VKERRATPRHRCRLRCALRRGSKREDALLLDVSLSGLSVQTRLSLAQGDEVEIEIAEGAARTCVRALAWNTRRVRRGVETFFVAGMMLAEAGTEYEALVARVAGSRPPAAAKPNPPPRVAADPAAAAAARPAAPPIAGPRRLPWWRLRVKAKDGLRTQLVTLAAASAEEAAAQALAEMGEGWEVLEVRPAAGGR
jgi:hypothetical protein